ncbi:SRPBCC family protein [Bdellovibrio sp. HCB209]|uniref:SRPBCC family protein n=1 Tax=Bdellovibrio sp. HCB209 TaxID=3394354 RepID=UPI0039B5901A
MTVDPKFDLVLEKVLSISAEKAWKGWTTPELICKWFCPEPWKVIAAKVDLRPGGIFSTTMQSPEGETFPPGDGCILEVVPGKKLVWTDALLPEFRPATPSADSLVFTAIITLEPMGSDKVKLTAIAKHGTEDNKKKHEEMGFVQGWGICADQLEKLMQN